MAAFDRVGTYWHMLPTLKQGRLVVWDGITHDGQKVLEAWPKEVIKRRREDEMKLELVNGSIWQVVGSDNYNSLMGANPVGVVFSEYSLADPAAWDFIRPILAENGGWALFLYTPRGPNHGQDLFDVASQADDWFCEKLSVDDTKAISREAIEAEKRAGMAPEMIQQEFYCSFDAPLVGAYFGQQMTEAQDEGRICSVPHDPAAPVETWWDLGIGDSTAIWFAQRVGRELHLIDYYETSGESLSHYASVLAQKAQPKSSNGLSYLYSEHMLPHDANARELGTGKTRVEVLETLGINPKVVALHRVEDGIEAARNMLSMCWFDAEKCKRGIDALRNYRKDWDEVHKVFRTKPLHDWASHGADALRTGAMAIPKSGQKRKPIQYRDTEAYV